MTNEKKKGVLIMTRQQVVDKINALPDDAVFIVPAVSNNAEFNAGRQVGSKNPNPRMQIELLLSEAMFKKPSRAVEDMGRLRPWPLHWFSNEAAREVLSDSAKTEVHEDLAAILGQSSESEG
tara:strand:+ start:615 stop:980 length:366 start_codon:yes stop_codon:yes gene_type:complete